MAASGASQSYDEALAVVLGLWADELEEITRLRRERREQHDELTRLWNSYVKADVELAELEAAQRGYPEKHASALLAGDEDATGRVQDEYRLLRDGAEEVRERREELLHKLAERGVEGRTPAERRERLDPRLAALEGEPREVYELAERIRVEAAQLAGVVAARAREVLAEVPEVPHTPTGTAPAAPFAVESVGSSPGSPVEGVMPPESWDPLPGVRVG